MTGSDIATVKEIPGHRRLAMTLRYAHLAAGRRANAMQMLDEGRNGKLTAHSLHSLKAEEEGGGV